MFVEILFPLQAVAADRHPMIGSVEDVGVLELAHLFEFLENAADLDVDIFATGILTTEFVADRAFVPFLPDSFHADFVA